MAYLIDLFLHLDVHLAEFVAQYGVLVYAGLFAVIFAETGLVVTPFLPGDSLLFAAGALAATGTMDLTLVLGLIALAAVIGNTVNYSIGRALGPRVFAAGDGAGWHSRLLNRKHLDRAHDIFEKHGAIAVISSRFAPIIRTFVPFVAGAARMPAPKFLLYNVAGGVLWTALCVGAGYAFGNVPVIKNNFSLVALGIVAVSLIPMVIEIMKARKSPG
ncbi:MAG TPA: DedA family protein [Vicinamibacterales bacterium]|nr:DedA family protein [Vicinamibacterales bacterium]